jgi:uncharacterized protein (TIGR02453 family)
MINRETLGFLKDLIKNNSREWFAANKERHDEARENIIAFTAELINELHKTDPEIDTALDPKKCVMRIYRDIRFSPNKTPYKNNFGVSIPTRGLRNGGAEYYMHITPGGSFIAGGYWMPQGDHLKAIRQEIDYSGSELKEIIDDPEFVKLFGDFRKQEQLKTIPQGYSADNEHIDLLKLKSFIAIHYLTDNEVCSKGALQQIVSLCNKIHPLNVFLKNALADIK